MKIKDYKLVTMLLMLMGLDTGAHVNDDAVLPPEWEPWFETAEVEAHGLSAQEAEDLTQGPEEDQVRVKEKAPYAYKILDAAFDDGPLSELVFRPWTTAVESKTAENRLRVLIEESEA